MSWIADGSDAGVETTRSRGSPSCRIRRTDIQTLFYEDILEGAVPRGPGRRHARHLAPLSVPRERGHAELRRRPLCELRARSAAGFADRAAVARPRRRRSLPNPGRA